MSHPVWVRGLKLCCDVYRIIVYVSHPVWVRGLKQHDYNARNDPKLVAPRVGAWIETYRTQERA